MLRPYRKLVAAFIGLGLLFVERRYDVDLFAGQEDLVEIAMTVLTGVAVWWFPNEKKA